MPVEVADHPDRSRYEIAVDGSRAGLAEYRRNAALIAFVHTEIDDAHEGQGLAGRLIATALDESRDAGLAVLSFCPFVRGYILKHPQYLDLVPADRRHDFDLPQEATDG